MLLQKNNSNNEEIRRLNNMPLVNSNMSDYEMIQKMTGGNRKLQVNLTEQVFQIIEVLNATMYLKFMKTKSSNRSF